MMQLDKRGDRQTRHAVQPGGLALQAVADSVKARQRVYAGIAFAVSLVAFIVTLLSGALAIWSVMVAIFALILAIALLNDSWLREADYYSVAGSRYADGSHRCVHCGGRGIWRKGQYRSNAVYARCSRCQSPLFKA